MHPRANNGSNMPNGRVGSSFQPFQRNPHQQQHQSYAQRNYQQQQYPQQRQTYQQSQIQPQYMQVLSSMKGAKAKNEASSTLKKVEDKTIGKRKTATKEPKVSSRQEKKGRKAAKDPNKPKRPASAFFVFMEDFRKTYKEKNPNVKSVSVVGKAGGDKWKSMSEADKAPFVAKAAKRKTEYEKNMAAYNNKQTSTAGDSAEESDKSKSEVNDVKDSKASGSSHLETIT